MAIKKNGVPTVNLVVDTMNKDQKTVLHALLAQALKDGEKEGRKKEREKLSSKSKKPATVFVVTTNWKTGDFGSDTSTDILVVASSKEEADAYIRKDNPLVLVAEDGKYYADEYNDDEWMEIKEVRYIG